MNRHKTVRSALIVGTVSEGTNAALTSEYKASEDPYLQRPRVPLDERLSVKLADWKEDVIREQTFICLVDGYVRKPSLVRGEIAELCVSARVNQFDIVLKRVGAKDEVIEEHKNVRSSEQHVPENASIEGCGWETSFEFDTAHLRPGFYQVDLRAHGVAKERELGHAFFIVRPRLGEEADIVLMLSTNTYNAYNQWGGPSLYDANQVVAYDRPLLRGLISRPDDGQSGRVGPILEAGGIVDPELTYYYKYCIDNNYSVRIGLAGWHNQERRFVQWAESRGLKVDLCVNNDVEDAELLSRYKLVLSVGHDEYWTMEMRDTLLDWVRSGGNLASFSGNTAYWRVRVDDNVMICHKYGAEETDPVAHTEHKDKLSGMFIHRWVNKPENELLGVGSNGGLYVRFGGGAPRGSGGFTVYRPDHWALKGTDLRYGDLFGAKSAIVSFETNGCRLSFDEMGMPNPTGEFGTPEHFEIIGISPALLWSGDPNYNDYPPLMASETATFGDAEWIAQQVYGDVSEKLVARLRMGYGVMGAMKLGQGEVFAGSTTHWAYGLGNDDLVDTVTMNVLNRFTS